MCFSDAISKAELRLTDIAEALQGDWVPLGQCLGIDNKDIDETKEKYDYESEQALIMLHLWIQQFADAATGKYFLTLSCEVVHYHIAYHVVFMFSV